MAGSNTNVVKNNSAKNTGKNNIKSNKNPTSNTNNTIPKEKNNIRKPKKESKKKKKKAKKGSKKIKELKKEILRLKLNLDDMEKKNQRLKKIYFQEKEEHKKKTQKIKRMLSTSDKIIPSLKDLKNNILVSYQTFEQLNTLLGDIYLEKENPPTPKKK